MNGQTYDAAGNILSLNGNTALYDAENRLTLIAEPPAFGGGIEAFSYDGEGRRIQKTDGGATTVYVYDVFGRLAAEYSDNAPSPPPCKTCYLSYDHLGSIRLVTDQSTNVIARHDYLPFGEEIPAGSAGRTAQLGFGATDNVTQRFTGQIRDSETGLDYFNARYFGAALSRFTSVDPNNAGAKRENPQSWNAYAYVLGNPLHATDPTGMVDDEDPWDEDWDGDGGESGGGGGDGPISIYTPPVTVYGGPPDPVDPDPTIIIFCLPGACPTYNAQGIAMLPRMVQPVPSESKFVIDANRGVLNLYKIGSKTCAVSGTYHYTTGMNGSRDYRLAGKGPLPPGGYTLHPYEISAAGFSESISIRGTGAISAYLYIQTRAQIPIIEAASFYMAATSDRGRKVALKSGVPIRTICSSNCSRQQILSR